MIPEQLFGIGDLSGWTVVPHMHGGAVGAYAIVDGTEIHYTMLPTAPRSMLSRRSIREFLEPFFSRRGYLTTRAVPGADTSFIERLGFVKTWSDSSANYFMLTALPYSKKEN